MLRHRPAAATATEEVAVEGLRLSQPAIQRLCSSQFQRSCGGRSRGSSQRSERAFRLTPHGGSVSGWPTANSGAGGQARGTRTVASGTNRWIGQPLLPLLLHLRVRRRSVPPCRSARRLLPSMLRRLVRRSRRYLSGACATIDPRSRIRPSRAASALALTWREQEQEQEQPPIQDPPVSTSTSRACAAPA